MISSGTYLFNLNLGTVEPLSNNIVGTGGSVLN
jgi:hypothetical protein